MNSTNYQLLPHLTQFNQDIKWVEKYQQFQICRYNTLMIECKEELRSLLKKVKEENENAGLKLNIQKTKVMASRSHHFKEKMGK